MNINILATCTGCNEEVEVQKIYIDRGNNLYVEVDSCVKCIEEEAEKAEEDGKASSYNEGYSKGHHEGFIEGVEKERADNQNPLV